MSTDARYWAGFKRKRQDEEKFEGVTKRKAKGDILTEAAKTKWEQRGRAATDYTTVGLDFDALTQEDKLVLQDTACRKVGVIAAWIIVTKYFGKISFKEFCTRGGIRVMDFATSKISTDRLVFCKATLDSHHSKIIEQIGSVTSNRASNPLYEVHQYLDADVDAELQLPIPPHTNDLLQLTMMFPGKPVKIVDNAGTLTYHFLPLKQYRPDKVHIPHLSVTEVKGVKILQKQVLCTGPDSTEAIGLARRETTIPDGQIYGPLVLGHVDDTADSARNTIVNALVACGYSMDDAKHTKGLRDGSKRHMCAIQFSRSCHNPSSTKFKAPDGNRSSILECAPTAKTISILKATAFMRPVTGVIDSLRGFMKAEFITDPNAKPAIDYKNAWKSCISSCAQRFTNVLNKNAIKEVASYDPCIIADKETWGEVRAKVIPIDTDEGLSMPFIGYTSFTAAMIYAQETFRAQAGFKSGTQANKQFLIQQLVGKYWGHTSTNLGSQFRTVEMVQIHEFRMAFGTLYEPVEVIATCLDVSNIDLLSYYDLGFGTLEMEGLTPSGLSQDAEFMCMFGAARATLRLYPEKTLVSSKSELDSLFPGQNFHEKTLPKGTLFTRTAPLLKKPSVFTNALTTRYEQLMEGDTNYEIEGKLKLCDKNGREVPCTFMCFTSPENRGPSRFMIMGDQRQIPKKVAFDKMVGVKYDDALLEEQGYMPTKQDEDWAKKVFSDYDAHITRVMAGYKAGAAAGGGGCTGGKRRKKAKGKASKFGPAEMPVDDEKTEFEKRSCMILEIFGAPTPADIYCNIEIETHSKIKVKLNVCTWVAIVQIAIQKFPGLSEQAVKDLAHLFCDTTNQDGDKVSAELAANHIYISPENCQLLRAFLGLFPAAPYPGQAERFQMYSFLQEAMRRYMNESANFYETEME